MFACHLSDLAQHQFKLLGWVGSCHDTKGIQQHFKRAALRIRRHLIIGDNSCDNTFVAIPTTHLVSHLRRDNCLHLHDRTVLPLSHSRHNARIMVFPQYRVITKSLSALFVHFVLRAVFLKCRQDQRLTIRNSLPNFNNSVGIHCFHYFVVKFLRKQRYVSVFAHFVSVCHVYIVLIHVLRRHTFGHRLTDDVCILEVVSLPRHVSRARVDTQRHGSLFVCKVRTH